MSDTREAWPKDDGGPLAQISEMYAADNARRARERRDPMSTPDVYELAWLDAILDGIDRDCVGDDKGWWETSTGAEFGAGKLAELQQAITARIAELEGDVDRWRDRAVMTSQRLGRHIAELEKAVEDQVAEIADKCESITQLRGRLREEGNRSGRLEDQLHASCTQGADAAARVTELERERDDHAHAAWLAQMRVAALEAAQRPPLAAMPSLANLRRYLEARGWSPRTTGPAGTMWTKDGARIAVPHELDDHSARGVLDRIAHAEQRGVETVLAEVREMQP